MSKQSSGESVKIHYMDNASSTVSILVHYLGETPTLFCDYSTYFASVGEVPISNYSSLRDPTAQDYHPYVCHAVISYTTWFCYYTLTTLN